MPHTASHALCQELCTDDLFGSLHELFEESNSSELQFRNPQNRNYNDDRSQSYQVLETDFELRCF